MIYDILFFNILFPVALGAMIGVLTLSVVRHDPLASLLVGAACIAVLLVLNGVPRFPPVASSERLVAAAIALVIASLFLHRLGRVGTAMTVVLWLAGAVWIGGARMQEMSSLPRIAGLVAVILAAGVAAFRLDVPSPQALSGTVPPLVFTIVAAFLSLTGGFIGNAQLLGAFAALTGGAVLIAYLADIGLLPLRNSTLSKGVTLAILGSVVLITSHSAMFAPNIHWIALIIASSILLFPDLLRRLTGLNKALAPFVFAAISVVPGTVAIGVSLL